MNVKYIFFLASIFCFFGIVWHFTFTKDVPEISFVENRADSIQQKYIPNENNQTKKLNDNSIYISKNIESNTYHVQNVKKLKDFENEYFHYKNAEIQYEINKLNDLLISRKLIINSNNGKLTMKEANILASLLRKKSMLHKILLDRKIHSLEAKL